MRTFIEWILIIVGVILMLISMTISSKAMLLVSVGILSIFLLIRACIWLGGNALSRLMSVR